MNAIAEKFREQAAATIKEADQSESPTVQALGSMLEMVLAANELMQDQVQEQHLELTRSRSVLGGLLAGLPARLAFLIEYQDEILVQVQIPFTVCPGCKHAFNRRLFGPAKGARCHNIVTRDGQKVACATFFRLDEHLTHDPRTLPLSEVIFDRSYLSPKEQANLLTPWLTGVQNIVRSCLECHESREDCGCEGGPRGAA